MTVHDLAVARLVGVGQRYTSGRRDLVDRLAAAGRPVTLPELLAAPGEALPQSSAYRNLTVLEQAGVVHRVHGSHQGAHFELAEDLTEHHHHHLICSSCGDVADVTVPTGIERTLVRFAGDIEAATGFRPATHRLDLLGTCPACLTKTS